MASADVIYCSNLCFPMSINVELGAFLNDFAKPGCQSALFLHAALGGNGKSSCELHSRQARHCKNVDNRQKCLPLLRSSRTPSTRQSTNISIYRFVNFLSSTFPFSFTKHTQKGPVIKRTNFFRHTRLSIRTVVFSAVPSKAQVQNQNIV